MRKGNAAILLAILVLVGCLPSEKTIIMPDDIDFVAQEEALLQQCDREISRHPKEDIWLYRRAKIYMGKGKLKRAHQDIAKAVRLKRHSAKYHFLKAQIEAGMGETSEAVKSAREAELKGYNLPDIQLLMGKLQIVTQDYASAEISFRKYRYSFPHDPDVNYQLGAIYQVRGDTARASDFFDQALKANPHHEPTLANILEARNEILYNNRSFELIRKIDADKVRTGALLYQIGNAYQLRGKADTAYMFFERTVEADPSIWSASYQLARKFLFEREYLRAESLLVNSLEHNPAIEGGFDQLGWVYEYANVDLTKAREAYVRAQEFGSTKADRSIRRVEGKLRRIALGLPPQQAAKKVPDTVRTSIRRTINKPRARRGTTN